MENTKDWVVANISLPGASLDEFNKNGITSDNTTLESKEFYKGTKKIQELFTNPDNGKFDNDKYENFYNTMLYTYNEYSNKDYLKKADEQYDYSPFDIMAPENAKKRDNLYKVEKIRNPSETKVGIEDFNTRSKPNLSLEEVAQNNYVRDHISGKVFDWTPNDDSATGIFDFLSRPTLVLAQYESDGEHYDEAEGRNIRHIKGDYKLDEEGKPFFETLGDREVYNKEVLNWSDTLTKEGTWLNKYDFMDSDGINKTAIGSIMKTAVKVAPLFIPYVGEVYAAGILGQDIMNIAPILAKATIGSIVGDRDVDKEYWKKLNRIQGFAGKLTSSSVSDYAKNKMFSFENISSMMGEVFTQLYTQRAIASIPGYLGMTRGAESAIELARKSEISQEIIEKMVGGSLSISETKHVLERLPQLSNYINRTVKNTKLSRGLATTYMAAISAAGVTAQAKAIGLDERDTGLLYLGTAAGFFGMMTSLPIGEWALKGIGLEEAGMLVNKGIKAEAKPFMEQLKRLGKEVSKTPGTYQKIFKIGKDIGNAVGSKLKNVDGYMTAMASEGTEEITEQFMQDGITNIYNGLSTLGLTSTNKKDKFTYGSSTDILSNYAMNFLGGTMGGAMFHLKDKISNRGRSDDASTKDIYWLIRNGYKDKLVEETNKLIKKGYFGSTSLSAEQETIDIPGLGRRSIFKPKDSNTISQNEAIGNIMLNLYNNVEQQIFQEGLTPDSQITSLLDTRYDLAVKDLKVNSPLYEDFNNLTNDILFLNNEINKVLESVTLPGAPLESVEKAKLAANKLEIQLALKREELKKITTGEAFPEYQAQALFNMSLAFNGPFGNITKEDIARTKYNKSFKSITPDQKIEVEEEYKAYKEANQKDQLRTGYKKFTYLNQKTSPYIKELAKYAAQRKGHYTLVDALGNSNKFDLQNNTIGEINKAKSYLNKTLTISENLNKVIKGEKDVESILKAVDDILAFVTNPSIDKFDKSFISELKGVFDSASLLELGGDTMSLNSILQDDQYFNENGFDGMGEMDIDDILNDNLSNITDRLNRLSEEAKENTDLLTLISKIQNYIFSNPIIAGLNTKKQLFESSISGKTINTLHELLSKFEFIQNGTSSDILKVLTNEFEALGKVQNIMDYQIYNPETQENLEDAQVLLQQLQSIIIASTEYDNKKHGVSGYNTVINNTFPDSELATINQEESTIILEEIKQINNKIELFLRLSAYNKESKIKNLIASGVNMETLFYEQFKNGNFRKLLDSVEIEGDQLMTPELIEAIEGEGARTLQKSLIIKETKEGSPIESEEEVYQLEKEKLGIQKVFYERIQELISKHGSETVQGALFNNDIARKIFPVEELSHPTVTDFSATESTIHPHALFVWANTLMTIDPAEFYNQLRGSEIGDNKYDGIEQAKFIPFYAQEQAIKVALGMITNREWIGNSMELLGGPEIANTFMGSMFETFHNLVFIDGIPGVGKTTAVGYTIARILKRKGKSFWTAAPHVEQATQLSTTLENTDEKTSFTKETLLKEFFTENAVTEIITSNDTCLAGQKLGVIATSLAEKNKLITVARVQEGPSEGGFERLKLTRIDDSAFITPKNLPDVIFIDELTHFSMIELEALRQACMRLGNDAPIIIGLGDTMQNGFRIEGESHNIDMFRTWDTPKLTASLRTSNDLKNNNLIDIRARYNLIGEEYNKIFTGEIKSYELVKDSINKLHNSTDESTWFKLRQFIDDKGVIYGENISKEDEAIRNIKKLLESTTEKIGFITDNDTSSNKILNSFTPEERKRLDIQTRLDKRTLDDVQGLEYDHVIIDVDWNKLSKDPNFGPLNFITNVYTLTTRSRIGSIIVDKGFSTNPNIIVKQITAKQVIDIKLDKRLLDKYKSTRVKEVTELANLFDTTSSEPVVILPKTRTIPQTEILGLAAEIMEQEELANGKKPFDAKLNLSGELKNNTLITYPYYERIGTDYEDASLFPDEDGKPNVNPLSDIKSLVLYGRSQDEILTYLEDVGITDITKLKIVVRASRYNESTDRDQVALKTNQLDRSKELSQENGDPFIRTALKIERGDLEPFYITLSVFASSKSTLKSEIPKLYGNLENLTKKVDLELSNNENNPIDLEINTKDPFKLTKFNTNIVLHPLNEPIPFSEFKKKLQNVASVSPIYIFTGKESKDVGSAETDIVTKWIKDRNLAGKAAVFVSYNSDLSQDQLRETFINELTKGVLVPTVKVVLLNTKGTPAKEWFEKAWTTIANNLVKDKADRYPIGTLASQHMTGMIVNAIATIADSDKYKGKPGIKNIANEIVRRLGPDGMQLVHFDKNKTNLTGYNEKIVYPFKETKNLRLVAFPYNHTYKLLIGLSIAMNKTASRDESGGYFEPIDSYTSYYGEFLNELYKLLDEHFPHGIFAHPVYQAYGQRNSKDDYVQLATENYEDFEVTVLPTLPDSSIDLRLIATQEEVKEQVLTKKVENETKLRNLIQERSSTITDPDNLSSFNTISEEIMLDFIENVETNPNVISRKIEDLYNKINQVTFTKEYLLQQLMMQPFDNTDIKIEDILNPENDIINKGDGIFVISGNNAKFDFEITYNMNEINLEKRMKISTASRPIEDVEELAQLIIDTKEMINEFHKENIEFMIPGVLETVLSALDSGTREIIPGSPIQIAFSQLASQALTLENTKLYDAILNYTNTQNTKACNS